jgi:plastocyanin domain-containing protein
MNKIVLSIITMGLIIGIGIIFQGNSKDVSETVVTLPGQNIEIRDGIQYITIDAKGGYFPRVTTAEAGVPTKLIMKTNGTYDCSAALVIRSVGYEKMLPQTGEEIVDIGTSEAGSSVQGTCSMGMYSFVVNFS